MGVPRCKVISITLASLSPVSTTKSPVSIFSTTISSLRRLLLRLSSFWEDCLRCVLSFLLETFEPKIGFQRINGDESRVTCPEESLEPPLSLSFSFSFSLSLSLSRSLFSSYFSTKLLTLVVEMVDDAPPNEDLHSLVFSDSSVMEALAAVEDEGVEVKAKEELLVEVVASFEMGVETSLLTSCGLGEATELARTKLRPLLRLELRELLRPNKTSRSQWLGKTSLSKYSRAACTAGPSCLAAASRRPSLNERTKYSSLTRIRTVAWAVGATTKPGNHFSLSFFFDSVSTQTTLPICSSFSLITSLASLSSSSSELSSFIWPRRLPRRPPTTGLPKCSGCVRGN
ncbi:hypothetical protein FF38_08812 [Lucilia cuprina]|uniref:Uncharacterized protein n=1 Tax=Lucilia cuprina TaxID=7375 RepID=A0A0L0BQS5_LUCCU|nr:hypothetical protein FF38_08812 [Lucilia cuprina]